MGFLDWLKKADPRPSELGEYELVHSNTAARRRLDGDDVV
jgi:hypothetical protein